MLGPPNPSQWCCPRSLCAILPSRFERANVCRIPEAQAILVPRQSCGHVVRYNRNALSRVCCGRWEMSLLGCEDPRMQGFRIDQLRSAAYLVAVRRNGNLGGCSTSSTGELRTNASPFRLRLVCATINSPAYGRRRRGRRSHTGDTPGEAGSPFP